MERIIKSIRYYASNFPNENGKSLPGEEFFITLIGLKNNYDKYGTIIARKLNELKFISGEFDHIYINYSTIIEENKINISTRKPEKWIQYIDYGVTESRIKTMDEKLKSAFIIETTFLALMELYKMDNEKISVLENIKDQLNKYGDLLKIKYKTKETKKWKIDVYYQINPNGINGTKCIVEYKDYSNKCFSEEFIFNDYEYIYEVMDNILVKDNSIIITPKKSHRASLYIKDIKKYKIPIKIKIK